MHILRTQELISLHAATISRFGGLAVDDARSHLTIEKAKNVISRIQTVMYYRNSYNWNDPFMCAALHALMIAKAHAFADGNKRTALNAAGLLLKRAGIAIHDNEKLPELLAVEGMYIEELASLLENLMTDKLGDHARLDMPQEFQKLSRRAIDPANLQIAVDFVQHPKETPTFYLLGSSILYDDNNGHFLYQAVIDALLRQHPTWATQSPKNLLRSLRFPDENPKEKLHEICTMIRDSELIKIYYLHEFFYLSDEFLHPILDALDQRFQSGKTTVIFDVEPPEYYFTKKHLAPTLFFRNLVLCKCDFEKADQLYG